MIKSNYKKFYKALAVILSIMLCILGLAACSSASTDSSSDSVQNKESSAENESANILENSSDDENALSKDKDTDDGSSAADSATKEDDTITDIDSEEEPTEGAPIAPAGALIDDKEVLCGDIAGSYSGLNHEQASISIYSSRETENIVGNIDITDENGNTIVSGELSPLMINYYQVLDTPYTFTVYTDNKKVCFEMFNDKKHENYFVMTEQYES